MVILRDSNLVRLGLWRRHTRSDLSYAAFYLTALHSPNGVDREGRAANDRSVREESLRPRLLLRTRRHSGVASSPQAVDPGRQVMDLVSLTLGGLTACAAGRGLKRLREHRSESRGLADLLNWAFMVDDGVILQRGRITPRWVEIQRA